jgi:restriction system protein
LNYGTGITWSRPSYQSRKDSVITEQQQKAAVTPEQHIAGEKDTCVICGKSVTEKVKQYCLANQNRFGGNIYCYDHQRNQ